MQLKTVCLLRPICCAFVALVLVCGKRRKMGSKKGAKVAADQLEQQRRIGPTRKQELLNPNTQLAGPRPLD